MVAKLTQSLTLLICGGLFGQSAFSSTIDWDEFRKWWKQKCVETNGFLVDHVAVSPGYYDAHGSSGAGVYQNVTPSTTRGWKSFIADTDPISGKKMYPDFLNGRTFKIKTSETAPDWKFCTGTTWAEDVFSGCSFIRPEGTVYTGDGRGVCLRFDEEKRPIWEDSSSEPNWLEEFPRTFYLAAMRHDFCYHHHLVTYAKQGHGTDGWRGKKICDAEMLATMTDACRERFGWFGVNRYSCIANAHKIYQGLRWAHGGDANAAYNKTKTQGEYKSGFFEPCRSSKCSYRALLSSLANLLDEEVRQSTNGDAARVNQMLQFFRDNIDGADKEMVFFALLGALDVTFAQRLANFHCPVVDGCGLATMLMREFPASPVCRTSESSSWPVMYVLNGPPSPEVGGPCVLATRSCSCTINGRNPASPNSSYAATYPEDAGYVEWLRSQQVTKHRDVSAQTAFLYAWEMYIARRAIAELYAHNFVAISYSALH